MDPTIIGALIAGGLGLIGAITAALLSKRDQPAKGTIAPNVVQKPPEGPGNQGSQGDAIPSPVAKVDNGDSRIAPVHRIERKGGKRLTSRSLKTLRMTEVEQLYDADSDAAWTSQTTLQRLMNYDLQYFDGISQEHEGSFQLWIKKWTDHPDTGRVLFVRTSPSGSGRQYWKPIGYWSFASLSQHAFDLVKAGVFCDGWLGGVKIPEPYSDRDIRIVPSDFAGVYNMYFISVCLDKQHIASKAFAVLFDSFFDAVTEFAKQGIFFDELATHAYTERGEYWCEQLSLPRLRKHASGKGSIHYLRVPPWPSHDLVNRHPELLELYERKFGRCDAAPKQGLATSSGGSTVQSTGVSLH